MAIENNIEWVKVQRPQRWKPRAEGEELIGSFISKTTRTGDGGRVYAVVTIRTSRGVVTVAGVVIGSLFESAGCIPGDTVRIVFRGMRESNSGNMYRDFDLYLASD